MSKMRAKMRISSVNRTEYGETLKMNAVAKVEAYSEDGSDEDNTFAKFTPSADLEMQVNNPDLWGKFTPGDYYYLDFTQANTDKKLEAV